jgi:hypothetical protein
MWLAGWAARREPASDKAMELFAKAIAFEDAEGQRVVIVTADLLAIPRALAQTLSAKAEGRWQLPRERLLFNASHTHTAPEVRPDKVPFFEIPGEHAAKIEPYVGELEEKLFAIISAALTNLQPAQLNVRQTSVSFPANRRPSGGPSDPTVPLLAVTNQEGKPIAFLFGLACHSLTLPPEFCQYHGDYPGVAANLLERAFHGAKALFLSGAGADQNPFPRGTLELAERHGQSLATAIQTALTKPGCRVAPVLRAEFAEVPLEFIALPPKETLEADLSCGDPPRQRKAKFLLQALAEGRLFPSTYRCPVQVLRFGEELLLIGLGGEPPVDYALQFKSEFAGPLVWVCGYSNDVFGYLPNRRLSQEGGYEAVRSLLWSALPAPFTDTVEELVVGTVRQLVARARSTGLQDH